MQAHWRDWHPPERLTPHVTLLFGCRTFGANTTCDDIHHGPFPPNSQCMCAVCHKGGAGIERWCDNQPDKVADEAEIMARAARDIAERASRQRRKRR